MALKDLAASAASVNEETIESIVGNYVRYDLDDMKIVLTPEGSRLSNKHKVLVYLVANEGWVYLDKSDFRVTTAPKELENPLGIKGGSLRPVLRALESDNLLKKSGSEYRVLTANLSKIVDELGGK